MFKLDDNFLTELGLGGLPPAEKNKMLAHIYETLEMRVGMRLAEKMSNEQLDEFEAYINKNDEAGALKWLETNFPNYKQVVAEELEKLKSEIRQVAPQIVQQALDNAAQAGQQPIAAPVQQPATPQQQYDPQSQSQPQAYPPQQPMQPQYPPTAPQQPTPQFAPQQVNNPALNPEPQAYPQQPMQPQYPPQPAPQYAPLQPDPSVMPQPAPVQQPAYQPQQPYTPPQSPSQPL